MIVTRCDRCKTDADRSVRLVSTGRAGDLDITTYSHIRDWDLCVSCAVDFNEFMAAQR